MLLLDFHIENIIEKNLYKEKLYKLLNSKDENTKKFVYLYALSAYLSEIIESFNRVYHKFDFENLSRIIKILPEEEIREILKYIKFPKDKDIYYYFRIIRKEFSEYISLPYDDLDYKMLKFIKDTLSEDKENLLNNSEFSNRFYIIYNMLRKPIKSLIKNFSGDFDQIYPPLASILISLSSDYIIEIPFIFTIREILYKMNDLIKRNIISDVTTVILLKYVELSINLHELVKLKDLLEILKKEDINKIGQLNRDFLRGNYRNYLL